MTRSGSRVMSSAWALRSVRTNSPAPASKISENATCAITRRFLAPKRRPRDTVVPAFSIGATSSRAAWRSGREPNKTPVIVERPSANARTRESMPCPMRI